MQIDVVVDNISQLITKDILDSAIAKKVDQKYDYKAAGLESLTTMFIFIAIAVVVLAVVYFFLRKGGGQPVSVNVPATAQSQPKVEGGAMSIQTRNMIIFLFIVLLSIGLFFLVGYFTRWPPFQAQKGYWGCEVDENTGLFTGKCVEKTNATEGPFETLEKCQAAQNKDIPFCSDFYGCDYDKLTSTGESKCIAGKDNTDLFPFASLKECETSTARCKPFYEGNPSYQQSFNPYVDQCKELKDPRKPVNKDSKVYKDKKECCNNYNCPPAGPLAWTDVKSRNQNESDIDWARRIYDAMLQAPPGTRSPPGKDTNEGGVTTNAALLTGKNTIDKSLADSLCQNPCQWYYDKNVPVPLCNCAVSPRVSKFV